ncbi:response regulator transcription factor [Cupriavidus pauculus]|uniref:response regulator transcription factor n=1 Tax=Cupriavidus pauculus TaxID=82633 RepID=UPI003857566B
MRETSTNEAELVLRKPVEGVVYVVDDDELVRGSLADLFKSVDLEVKAFDTIDDFARVPKPDCPACLVLDVRVRGGNGILFQKSLADARQSHMPIVFISGYGDVPMTVKAMKAGAIDFLAKPFRDQDLVDAVLSGLELDRQRLAVEKSRSGFRVAWRSLTNREREVLVHVADGRSNREVAELMGVAELTTKLYRGSAMRKMNLRSVAELLRMMDVVRDRYEA